MFEELMELDPLFADRPTNEQLGIDDYDYVPDYDENEPDRDYEDDDDESEDYDYTEGDIGQDGEI